MATLTQKRPSIRDVAREAGVSPSTVSRVLNARPDVSPETRERVLQTIAALHYHPNAQAVGLSRRATGVVGLVVPDVITPFCTSVIESVQNSLRARGHWMLLAASGLSTEQEAQLQAHVLEELWRGRRIDGLVVLIPMESSMEVLRAMTREGLPNVLIDLQYEGAGLNYIAVDNYRGGYLATEHLLQLGYRDIAILCGPTWRPVGRDRLAGYRAALQEWGVLARPEWVVPGLGYNEETGQHAMRTLLEAERKPRAVFAVSDLVAFGAMAVLDEVGLRVPEDIAFIGFDDIPAAANFRPPLTTMRQPLSDMGRMAAEYVSDLLAGKAEEPLQVTMETKPVVRVSCGSEPRAPTAPPPTNTRSADQHHRAVAI
jgi:LacI family transcriptional regulator